MAGDHNKFHFNDRSEAHFTKMTSPQREHYQLMTKSQENQEMTHQADYERHRPQRIKEQEEQLTRHYQAQLNMPRPAGTPAPRIPTAKEIQNEATRRVDQGHARDRENMMTRHKNDREDFVRKALGLPSREEAAEARREEYFAQRRRQRDRHNDRER